MSVGKKIAVNSMIQIGGKILSIGIGLLTIKLLTSSLGVTQFGEYTIIITFLSIFAIIADLGLNVVLTTEISHDDPERTEKAIRNIFTLRCISSFVVIGIFGSLVTLFLPYRAEVKALIVLGSIAMIGISLVQVLQGIFQKELKTEIIAIAEMLSRIVFLGVILGLVFLFEISLQWVIVGFVVSIIVQFVYVFINAQRYIQIKPAFDIPYWGYALKEAFPLFIVITFNLVYYKVDTLMISIIQGPEDAGLYGVAYKVLEMMLVFPAMFAGLLLPLLTKYYLQNKQVFTHIVHTSFNILLGIGIPLVIGGILLSREIILLISSPDYVLATPSLRMLFGALGFSLLSHLMSHILIGAGFKSKIIIIAIGGAVFNVGVNSILIPLYSYTGAAAATLLTEGLVFLFYTTQVYRHTQTLPQIAWGMLIRVGISTGCMTGIILLLQGQNIILISLLSAITFGGCLVGLSGYDRLKKEYLIVINEDQ